MKIGNILIILFILLYPFSLYGAQTVVQTGVASAQTEAEDGNIEKLRERALRNAMDLAVLQVNGALLSGERGNTLRSHDNTTIRDNDVTGESIQQSRFHGTVTARTAGNVRLVEIVKEWRDGNQYYVEAKIEVGSPEEANIQMNAGFYWARAGKPSIRLDFVEEENDQINPDEENRTLRYLRDNLTKNGINVLSEKDGDGYRIKVKQELQVTHQVELGAYTVHCQLSFRITDPMHNETIAENRAQHGPVARFTSEQAKEACIKEIAAGVSEKMVREVAGIMNDLWNNGIEYKITISNFPADIVAEANDMLANLFKVSNMRDFSYKDNVLQISMIYKGTGVDLAEAMQKSFEENEWKISPEMMRDNNVHFRWTSQSQ